MGIFNRLFSSKPESETTQLSWMLLTKRLQLEELVTLSFEKKVVIFKHSTRCGISSLVLRQFEQKFQADDNTVLVFLDLLLHREISDVIADRFGVIHQSPQLLVIKNGVCTHNASHYGIVEMIED